MTRWRRLLNRLGDWRRSPDLRGWHAVYRGDVDPFAAAREGFDAAAADPSFDPLRDAIARARADALRDGRR